MRLDLYLVEKNIIKSREFAKNSIKNGEVTVNGTAILKPAFDVSDSDDVQFIGENLKYVGRGGLKLEKALSCFSVDLTDKTCIDVGASTGGFTDCMLKNGAAKVYAVDVGHGQLVPEIAEKSNVVNLEKTNILSLTAVDFEEKIDFISVDVSFVSLTKILPKVYELLSDENGICVILIKPQFEAGKKFVGKNGVVKDRKTHIRVLNEIVSFCGELGFCVGKLDFSPISGGEGNIEYLALLTKNFSSMNEIFDVKNTVEEAFLKISGRR